MEDQVPVSSIGFGTNVAPTRDIDVDIIGLADRTNYEDNRIPVDGTLLDNNRVDPTCFKKDNYGTVRDNVQNGKLEEEVYQDIYQLDKTI